MDNYIFFRTTLFLICIKLFIPQQVVAQDNTILAQSHYYKAEQAYNIGEYDEAIKFLEKAEGYAGTNHLIQYLKVKSLYMNKDYIAAKQAMKVFFDVIDPGLQSSSQYKEMVMLVADVETLIEAVELRKIEAEQFCNTSIICDLFDDYVVGDYLATQANGLWTAWNGKTGVEWDAIVTTEKAVSVPNSILLENKTSLTLPLNNLTAGSYVLGWDMYMPKGFGALIHFMHEKDPENSFNTEWGLGVIFNGDGTGYTRNGGDRKSFTYNEEKWLKVNCIIDLDNDAARLMIDGVIVREWQYSLQINDRLGIKQLAAIRFYTSSTDKINRKFYLDNIYMRAAMPVHLEFAKTKKQVIRITDPRDKQNYNTLIIGDQQWMIENLNYKMEESYSYDNKSSWRATYGLYYTWEAAKKACPTGWHLPSREEWQTLFYEINDRGNAGNELRSSYGWIREGNGSNTSGFNVVPAGFRKSKDYFPQKGVLGLFWTSTKVFKGVSRISFKFDDPGISHAAGNPNHAFSCRCLKD